MTDLKKITKSYDLSDYSVLTDTGYVPIKLLHETVPYNVYRLTLSDGKVLKCADNHIVFYEKNKKEVLVKNLKVGDRISVIDDSSSSDRIVLSVENLGYQEVMYDLELPKDSNHRYYTNGILSHNTALVEKLALMIYNGNCPSILLEKRIMSLDLTSLIAGTKYRGQFEERIKSILRELQDVNDVIVFIDEIHTMVGAGNSSGSMDVANIIKPALARGEIQCIGATTFDEYKKNIEKDGALVRRFQKITLNEPTIEETITILNNLKPSYENYHNVEYQPNVIETIVKLSHRYITDRYFPDKAIDVLDELGSEKQITITIPEIIENLKKQWDEIKVQKINVVKNQNYEQAAKLRDNEKKIIQNLNDEKAKWLRNKNTIKISVTVDDVYNIITQITGVPITKLDTKDAENLLNMEEILSKKIIGQTEAITSISKAVRRNRVGIKEENKPIGSFMFVGSTGVGKCFLPETKIMVRNKKTNVIEEIDVNELIVRINH